MLYYLKFEDQKILTLWPHLMHRVQLLQGCRVTTRRQFTFNYQVLRSSWMISEIWKVVSTIEWPSGFEPAIPDQNEIVCVKNS